jgi:hypothetical protein
MTEDTSLKEIGEFVNKIQKDSELNHTRGYTPPSDYKGQKAIQVVTTIREKELENNLKSAGIYRFKQKLIEEPDIRRKKLKVWMLSW